MSSRIKSAIKRMLAGVLAAAISVVLMPVGAAVSADTPPAIVDGESYSLHKKDGFDITNPDASKLDNTSSIDKGDLLLYLVQIPALADEFGTLLIEDNKGYAINFPENIVTNGSADIEYIYGSNPLTDKVKVGRIEASGSTATISFHIDEATAPTLDVDGQPTKLTLGLLADIQVAIGAKLSDDAEGNHADGVLTISIPGAGNISLTVNDWKPSDYINPSLSKTQEPTGSYGIDSEIPWKITYTGYKEGVGSGEKYPSDEIPKTLVDTFDSTMEYVPGSLTINGQQVPDSTVTVNDNIITYTLPEGGQKDVTMTYKTRLTTAAKANTEIISMWANGGKTEENSVQINNRDGEMAKYNQDGSDVYLEDTANVLLDKPSEPGVTGKNGEMRQGDATKGEDGTKYYIDWNVTINPQIMADNFSKFILHDKLGSALIGPSSVSIGSNSYTASVDSGTNEMTVDLRGYVNSATSKSAFTVKYTTQVADGYFNMSLTKEDLKNQAGLEWQLPKPSGLGSGNIGSNGTGDSASFFNIISPTIPNNISAEPIRKAAVGDYDDANKRFTWKVSVGFTGAQFSEIHLVDDPGDLAGNYGGTGEVVQRFVSTVPGSTETAEQAATKIANNIKGVSGFPGDATVKVKITQGTGKNNGDTLAIDITTGSEKIKGPLEFEVYTYSSRPIDYAGNNDQRSVKNRITMLDSTKLWDALTSTAKPVTAQSAEATNNVNGQIIKKNVSGYDAATNQVTWTLKVNERGANLGQFRIEDNIPAGLTYVEGSSKIKWEGESSFADLSDATGAYPKPDDVTESKVYVNGSKLDFVLKVDTIASGDKAGKGKSCEITFITELDPKSYLKDSTDTTVEITNQVNTYVKDPYDSGEDWLKGGNQTAGASNKIVAPNEVVDKSSVENGQRVTYTVHVNPAGMDLIDPGNELWVTDTMDVGLVIDRSTVKLYKASKKAASPTGTGSLTIPSSSDLIPDTTSVDTTVKFETNSDGKTVMKVKIENKQPYVLVYDAITVVGGKELKNHVGLEGSVIPDNNKVVNDEIGFSFSSYSSATLRLPKHMTTGPYAQYLEISLLKQDTSGNAIPGAIFGLYKESGAITKIAEGTTDSKGGLTLTVSVTDLGGAIPEKVYLKEIRVPSPYVLNDSVIEVTTATLGTKGTEDSPLPDLVVQNLSTGQDPGKIVFKKTGSGGAALAGALFDVYKSPKNDSDSPIASGISGSDGIVKINNLEKGAEYIVVESVAPAGYELDTTERKYTAVDASAADTPSGTVTNKKSVTKHVKVTKVWAGDSITERPAKVSVQLYDTTSGTEKAEGSAVELNVAGSWTYMWTGLDPDNTYIVKENAVPEGYNMSSKHEGDVWTITNTKKPVTPDPKPEDPPKEDPPKEDPPKQDPPAGTPEKPGGGNSGGSTGGGGGSPSGPGTGGGSPSGSTPITSTPKPVDKTPEVKPETETYAPPVVDPNKPIKVDFVTTHGETPDPQIKTPGQTADDPGAPMDPSTLKPGDIIDGYRFDGWYLDPEYTMLYDFTNPLLGDTTLYAKWTKLGTGFRSPKTADEFDPIRLLVPMFAFLVGYMFVPVTGKKKEK